MNPEPPRLQSAPLEPAAPPVLESKHETPRPWGFWLTVAFGLCIAGGYIMAQSVVVVIVALSQGKLSNPAAVEALATNGLVLSVCLIVSVPMAIGSSALFAWLRRGLPVAEYLGFKPVSWKIVGLGLGCVAVLGVAYDWISTAAGRPAIPEFMRVAYTTAGFAPLLWVAVILGAPLSEEIFFRGFLFKGFEQSALGGVGTIVLTAVIWAAIHLQYDLWEIGWIFVLGLLLGFFRLKTGSILPPLLMHMLINGVSTVQVALALNG